MRLLNEDTSPIVLHSDHLTSTNNGNIIIFADTDILANNTWTQKQDNFGKETFTPIADNGSLVINAVESLQVGEN